MANLKIGDIVEIVPGMETDAEGIWNVPAGKLVLCKKEDGTYTYASMLDMEIVDYSSVDWDAFRREAAKDLLCALVQGNPSYDRFFEVHHAVIMVDELIKTLKKEEGQK